MNELTLESLAKRVEALEKLLAERTSQAAHPKPNRDWLKVVGLFDGDKEFATEVIAEGQAIREADRKAACEGQAE